MAEEALLLCQACSVAISQPKRCSRCGAADYCSRECQKDHWTTHKTLCSKLKGYKNAVASLETAERAALGRMVFKLPPCDEEYFKECKWATRADQEYFRDWLKEVQELVDNSLSNIFKVADDANPQRFYARWREISPALMSFLNDPVEGDVFRDKTYGPHKGLPPQQFRNTPLTEPANIQNGNRVVDIGFVDFGIIIDSLGGITDGGAKVSVTGIESEPFCVAKSTILMAMIKDQNTAVRSVVEVWMSSFWSRPTFGSFKTAAKEVLARDTIDPRVRKIIEFWAEAPMMPATYGMEYQLREGSQKTLAFAMKCCNLRHKRDRVDYLRYSLHKSIYEEDTSVLASVVMCMSNDKIGVTQSFEDVIEAVPAKVFQKTFRPDLGCFERIRYYFETQVGCFMRLVRSGTVEFVPTLGVISIDNASLTQEIKALRPHVIHWSNVIDYLKPCDFHSIARAISGPETIHFAHSCNWTTIVFGTDLLDLYSDVSLQLQCFTAGLIEIERLHSSMDLFVSQGLYAYYDYSKLVLLKAHIKSFFRFFFEGQDVTCCAMGNDKTPLQIVWPFSRSVSTAFFSFAYADSAVSFDVDDIYNFSAD